MSHLKRSQSKVSLVILLVSLVLLAMACGTAAPAEPTTAPQPTPALGESATPTSTAAPQVVAEPAAEVHPGKLTIMAGDWSNERFHNAVAPGVGGNSYGRWMAGLLISTNERMEMVPGIASQWGLSADGLTWTFTIRQGVKFHDGSDLTPQDAHWTLQHLIGPEALEYTLWDADLVRISRDMDRIELSGPDDVGVTTKKPFTDLAFLLSETGSQWFHIVPKRAQLHDEQEALAYDTNPIGAGPMRLVEHVKASVMKFERFDDFYYQPENGLAEDKRVNFQSLDIFLVPEEATRVAALRAGEADIAPASLATREQVEAGGGRLVFGPEGVAVEVRLLGCWELQYPCHDKRVRQALDYAVDKELIRDRLYGGPEVFEVKGWNLVTPSTIGYSSELDPRPFDPGKARELLADAGYPGGQGFGKLIVNVAPAPSLPFAVEGAQLAAEFWKRELGLDAEVRVGDKVSNSELQRAGEFNGQVMWSDNETRPDATSTMNGKYADPTGTSRLHEDPELVRVVQEAFGKLDPDQRAEASNELYLLLRDENYHISIGYANIPWGVGPRVLTWRPNPLTTYVSAPHTITLK
jgi:peptide/nickel transport system substrate-binding protein